MIYNSAEGLQAKVALTQAGMAVLVTAKGIFGVVQVERVDPWKAESGKTAAFEDECDF